MSYAMEDNLIHVYEREEARDAARFSYGTGSCRQHRMRPDGHGGGACECCGDTVTADEL